MTVAFICYRKSNQPSNPAHPGVRRLKTVFEQYRQLAPSKRKLADKISNVWFIPFAILASSGFFISGLLFGFTIDEILDITKNTPKAGRVLFLGFALVPFASWVAWAIGSLPFIVSGELSLKELGTMLFKLKFPVQWDTHD